MPSSQTLPAWRPQEDLLDGSHQQEHRSSLPPGQQGLTSTGVTKRALVGASPRASSVEAVASQQRRYEALESQIAAEMERNRPVYGKWRTLWLVAGSVAQAAVCPSVRPSVLFSRNLVCRLYSPSVTVTFNTSL